MKEIKIVLSGEKEEQIAQHIMKSVYEAINEHGYCDINLCADTMSSRASLEAVGAAKVLKLAIRLREFSEEVREKGEHEYKLVDQYNYIKDILDA